MPMTAKRKPDYFAVSVRIRVDQERALREMLKHDPEATMSILIRRAVEMLVKEKHSNTP